MPITSNDITGLILAGGRGRRLGGVDKGLQLWCGQSLVEQVLQRLAVQVSSVMISANRNLEFYRALGWPVVRDAQAGFLGPLAGLLSGLAHAHTAYVLSAACDCPGLPLDLGARLADALHAEQAQIAMAVTPSSNGLQTQPMFCLVATELRQSLSDYLQSGQRQAWRWAAQQRCVHVQFDNAVAFFNVNTAHDLATQAPG
jgi:molybdenum cofactor guanylyltransferase